MDSGYFKANQVAHEQYDIQQTEGIRTAGMTVFDEVSVAEYTPDFIINPTYGLTDYRLRLLTSNSGSISEDSGSFLLSTGTTASSDAAVQTAELGDYSSGSMALAGILVFRPNAPTGNEELSWGYFSDTDGFRFGEDSTGVFVQKRSGGTDFAKVYQQDWNVAKLDGTGEDHLNLDLSYPHAFRIRMSLYGQGPVEMQIEMVEDDGHQHLVTVHRFSPEQGALISESWGLPVKGQVDNGGDSTSVDMYVGGMQFGIIGKRIRKPRTVSETTIQASLSGTTIVPLVSIQKKSTSQQINVRIAGFTPLSADDLIVYVFLDGTLTGASFGSFTNVDASETALQVDTSATDISGGNVIYEDTFAGGGGNKLTSPGNVVLGQVLPFDSTFTLAARLVSGTGGSGTFTLRAEEDW